MTAIPPPPDVALYRSALADLPRPGFANTLRSEWSKLWTTKAPRRNLILGAVLGIGLSALMSFAIGSTFDDWSASDRAEFDPVAFSFVGSILTTIFFVAVGSRTATAEYATDMIRVTFTATPRRNRVVLAKAIVVCVVCWAFGAVAVFGMVAACQAVFAAYDISTVSVLDAEVLRTLGVMVLLVPVFPLLAVAAGMVFRGTAPTITVVLLLLLFPSIFGGFFPRTWQENFFSLFPSSATDALTVGDPAGSPMYLDTLPSALIVLAWTVLPVVAAVMVLDRRDA